MSRPIVVTVCMSGSCESWGLNSTHIHGTHVPVEEPSTASGADMRSSLDQYPQTRTPPNIAVGAVPRECRRSTETRRNLQRRIPIHRNVSVAVRRLLDVH